MPEKSRAVAVATAGVAAALVAARSPWARRLLRAPDAVELLPPVPPRGLPPGYLLALPGRGEVFVRDSGPRAEPAADALPVLLLHGWTASADLNFFSAYGPLMRDRRVIALDHRGHGRGLRSEERFALTDCADDAAAVLAVLGVDRAVAVGYSMGGPVAMLLAQRHPDLVGGIVVQATALEWSGEWWERERWRVLALLELGMRLGTGESVVARALRRLTRRRPDLLPLRPWIASELRRGDAGTITDAGRALASYDARPWAASLGIPAAAVVTSRDRLVPAHKQRALAEALHARVFELAADHDAPVLQADAFGAVTRRAVAAVAAASRPRQTVVAGRPH